MKLSPGFLLRIACGAALFVLAAVPAQSQPSSRTSAQLAFEPGIGRPVLFGGLTPLFVRGDRNNVRDHLAETWEWTGRRWVQRYLTEVPPPRAAFAMVSDFEGERVLLFGGGTVGDGVLNDTWQFKDRVWTQIETATAPPARRLPGHAFDRDRGRFIIFGGGAETVFRDTWEFDGRNWRQTGSDGPQVLNPTLTWDGARNEVLMVGLAENGTTVMYRYLGSAWERIQPETLPDCVSLTGMVWQQHNGKVLMAGGGCINGNALGQTWEWDGVNWTRITTTGGVIGGVIGHAMTYDSARGETILFGGSEFGFDRSDTYRYRDGRWLRVGTTYSPGPRSLMVFESAPEHNAAWLFGGLNAFGDLWKYANGNWQRVAAENQPSTCLFPAGTWDSARKRLVIVCNDSSVHEWDGESWTAFPSLDKKPPVLQWRSFVYDPKLGRSVLYGGWSGNYSRETWTWNGSTWTKVDSKKHPGFRALAMMFFDPVSQRTILYGGIGRTSQEGKLIRFGDTWAFDGKDWVELTNVSSPPPRYGALIGVDPQSGLVHMVGGKDENEAFIDDHYTWNGSKWSLVAANTELPARQNGGLTWDPTLERMTIFGGFAGYYFSDLWTLTEEGWRPVIDEGVRQRPAARPSSAGQAGIEAGVAPEPESDPVPPVRRRLSGIQ
jgi:hypothetical protein